MVKFPAKSLLARLQADLGALASQSQLRHLSNIQGVNFCSNDYLGLATDPRIQQAVAAALAAGSATGATGSRLLSGNAAAWEDLETELAHFAGTEAALYFSSGYAANVGLFSCIATAGDIIFSDSANHASIIDGIRLSPAQKIIFPHLDLNYLEQELRKCEGASSHKIIAVESVFSMDGDRAPIRELVDLADRYGAELIVDEAHATGIFGPNGRGLTATCGLDGASLVVATIHPCGKAFGGMGAFVCCSEILKQYLVNRARTFVFSTALPPYMAAQMHVAVRLVAAADAARSYLTNLSAMFRSKLRAAGFDTGRSDSQIVPVLLGDNERALQFATRLCDAGFGVRAIRPPTVPAGTSRLRLSLTTRISAETIEAFVSALTRIREERSTATCGAVR